MVTGSTAVTTPAAVASPVRPTPGGQPPNGIDPRALAALVNLLGQKSGGPTGTPCCGGQPPLGSAPPAGGQQGGQNQVLQALQVGIELGKAMASASTQQQAAGTGAQPFSSGLGSLVG